MSGSEIAEVIREETSGRWKPSPGSIYPCLAWLKVAGYITEVPTREPGMKRYMLTEQGEKLFVEQTRIKEELEGKLEFLAPLLFWPKKFREPARRLIRAFLDLRALEEKLTERDLEQVRQILDESAKKMEEISGKLKEGNKDD